jgi:thymidylate synthase
MGERMFSADTLDDVMHLAIKAIQSDGERVANATKGANTELRGVVLEIANPRARLSRTETRGKPFSCLGELCWYLSATNDTKFIEYYVPVYKQYDEGGGVWGGYGPRLFKSRAGDQIANVKRLLNARRDSRRAVIQLFDCEDIARHHEDVPCTCTLQLLIRNDALHMVAYMRSNDIFWGLPHDVFCFTMLQEIIARDLAVSLGTYTHIAGSLHLYDHKQPEAQSFIDEGWQPTNIVMPSMPEGDPWPAIDLLCKYEKNIRSNGPAVDGVDDLDVYWADIVRLLQIFKCIKNRDIATVAAIREFVAAPVYHLYIDSRLRELSEKAGNPGEAAP